MTWALPVVAGCLLAFAAVAGRLRGTPITAPIVFSTLGLLLGTLMLDVIDLDVAGEAVKLLAEVTLALVLFVDASTVDFSALRRTAAIPERLLGIGLPLDDRRRLRHRPARPGGPPVARGPAPRRDARPHRRRPGRPW